MKEIAELAGVSVAAVSYALNGTGNISEKKTEGNPGNCCKGRIQPEPDRQKPADKKKQHHRYHGGGYHLLPDTQDPQWD